MKKTGYPLCIIMLLTITLVHGCDLYIGASKWMGFTPFWDNFGFFTDMSHQSKQLNVINEGSVQEDDYLISGLTEFINEENSEKASEEETTENVNATSEEQPEDSNPFTTVDESYFDDAVFIGDSRIVGLYDYSGLENTDFYGAVGMNVYDLFTKKFIKQENSRKKLGLEEVLTAKQYKKVYLMVGINELGRGTTESFLEEYTTVVNKIMELQPDAIIYVQAIMTVSAKRSNKDPIFNNTNIAARNDAIKTLTDNQRIYWIDVNEVLVDENGNLNSEYTGDGTHLKAKYYSIWVDFLKSHAVVKN